MVVDSVSGFRLFCELSSEPEISVNYTISLVQLSINNFFS